MQDFSLLFRDIENQLISTRRTLHQHPELGFDLPKTVEIISSFLDELQIPYQTKIGKSGIVADLIVKPGEPFIALRADMDALPMQEKTQLPYESLTPGKGHMCGHDIHTTMLLGAASILSKNKSQLKRNIRFIFQPNEENLPGGASFMIKDGALENVECIYGWHVWPTLLLGEIGICDGPAMGQPDVFEIKIIGKGGHAAMPHLTIDPIQIAASFIQNCQSIVARSVAPLESAVVSFTKIEAGTTHNIIPESVSIMGTIRTLDHKVKERCLHLLKKQLEALSLVHNIQYELSYEDGHPVTVNDTALSLHASKQLTSDQTTVIYPHLPFLTGEDFGYYSQLIPSCFLFLGCSEEEGLAGLHSPYFNPSEKCIEIGIKGFVELALSHE